MIEITAKELELKYKQQTLIKLSIELGISVPTLLKKIKKAGIPLKGAQAKLIVK
jgi:hypothetical protein